MKKINSYFISKIINNKVYNIQGASIGKLNDFVMDVSKTKPVIKAVEIKTESNVSYISAKNLEVFKTNNRYIVKVNTDSLQVLTSDDDNMHLFRDFLDKQIVDINDKKVVRVNDVRMGCINGTWNLVAVDVGFRGVLRRLGFERAIGKFMNMINYELRNTLIVWDSVHSLNFNSKSIKLSTKSSKIEIMHAADIADIIEDLDKKARECMFDSMDEKRAAEVLEEVEPRVQLSILKEMSDERASDILENMPSDEAADILEEIDDNRRNELLRQMEDDTEEKIRRLMEYEDKTVGSVMTTDYVAFLPDICVEDALIKLRELESNPDSVLNFYVINNKGKLLGGLMAIDLIQSKPDEKIYDLMDPDNARIKDQDYLEDAMELMQKYSLVSLPVTNESGKLVGITTLNDLVHEYFKGKKPAA